MQDSHSLVFCALTFTFPPAWLARLLELRQVLEELEKMHAELEKTHARVAPHCSPVLQQAV
jgi:hypothetical protein